MSREFFERRYESIGGRIIDIKIKPSLRVNTLRTSDEELVKRLSLRGVSLERVKDIKSAYYYKSKFSISSTPEFLLGYFYIQELNSMLAPIVLNPSKEDKVLDMCAAPGSKTTQLSALMNNKGVIVALEKSRNRMNTLRLNLERTGCHNVLAYNIDALEFNSNSKFDRILLDAPCSGNYTQQKDWFNMRTLKGILTRNQIQKKLIRKAHSLLKEGGELVYSTCSLEPEEDEFIVDYALRNGFDIKDTGLKSGVNGITEFQGYKLDKKVKLSRRFWPFATKGQGFFIAKLVKPGRDKNG